MSIQPKNDDLLMRLMSSAALRRDVLANNVASQNMPGYRRRDVQFEELLADALRKGERPKDLNRISPKITVDFDTPARADGNNVSPEEEASLMRENRIQFDLYAMIKSGRGRLLSLAINSDR